MDQQEFVTAVLRNPVNRVIVTRLRALELSDGWLVSGALFQSVWNAISGLAPDYGIKDYDIFYFDPDLSWDAEDAVIKGASQLFADLGRQIEIRNQARVHLWYQEKFGTPYPPLSSTTEHVPDLRPVGIGHDLTASRVRAPRLLRYRGQIIRPIGPISAENYYAKASRWQSLWPKLNVMAA